MHYQNIDIDDVRVKGICREKDYRNIFPVYPQGLKILDIGCNIGFYSLKAASEGAKFVLGVDNSPVFLDIAKDVKKRLKYNNVEFILMDVLASGYFIHEAYDPFDVVLCLNLVHHFQTIKQVEQHFDDLDKCTNKLMVFEFLNTDCGTWAIIPNSIGNPKIYLSYLYFQERYPDAEIRIMDSDVTRGRKIIHVRK